MSEKQTTRVRVLVITPDVLGAKMAGPGIRAFEIAKALHEVCEVRLVSTQSSTLVHEAFPVKFDTESELRKDVKWAEVIVFQGHTLSTYPWVRHADAAIVADIYDPMHLEFLETGKDMAPKFRVKQTRFVTDVLNVQLDVCDYFLCASEKQRDFWLGQLAGLGRINPFVYDADPSLRSFIDISPFGVANVEAVQTRHAIKGVVPGIEVDDQVILWGGGVYNWFDPLTLIRSIDVLVERNPKLKLYFLGVKHPNPKVPAMRMAAQAMQLADELGLTNKHVFFNTDWVDYDDRVNYLLDADLGVSTHLDHVETAFSFRTRILDYLWAGLPIVATDGDTFAGLIRQHDLGAVVPAEDVQALADAIERVLYSEDRAGYGARSKAFGQTHTWADTLAPLVAFCQNPHRAPDRHTRHMPAAIGLVRSMRLVRHTVFWRRTGRLRQIGKDLLGVFSKGGK